MGHIDPTGTYMYDEDDDEATFSELLNLGQNAESEARAYFRGTGAERDALDPAPPGAMWKQTDGQKRLYSAAPDGTWRLHEGKLTDIARAWDASAAPVYARTITWDVPTILAADETLEIVTALSNASFTTTTLATLTRYADKTVISCRYMKFFNATIDTCDVLWRVVSVGT